MGGFMIGIFNTSAVMGLSIAAAGILLKASRKSYSAGCRKRIWIFMAFGLLIPFHLFRFPGAYTAEIPNVVLRESGSLAADGAGGQGMMGGAQALQGQTTQSQTAQNQAAQKPAFQGFGQGASQTELTVADVLFAVWACVGVLLAAYSVAGYWRMRGRIRRWGSKCEDGRVQEILAESASECRLKRIPEVYIIKDSAEGPFTTGVLKNIIVLPNDALHERDLRFILKHEAIHCRNNDISWKLLFLTVNIIHWFNPFAWYLRRAAEQDMEIACDEEVVYLASREERKEYSDVIMSWVERSRYRGSAVSTGYVRGVGFLKRRFDNIFNGGKKKNGLLLAGGVCLFALLTGCVIQLQSGGRVYAKKKIAIDYGYEVRTDVDGDGKVDRVYVSDNNLAGWDSVETSVGVRLGNGGEAWISYPDYWMSYLVTGDLSGNGAADIVLVRIARGSVHYTGDVTVLHVQTDETGKPELVEYPGNFIPNPELELEWVGWEDYTGPEEYIPDDEYSTAQPAGFGSNCMGAAIIEKDGKTMLRVAELVDAWTESAKCIDCIYTADGWYIEDMQLVYAFDAGRWEDELLAHTWYSGFEGDGEETPSPMADLNAEPSEAVLENIPEDASALGLNDPQASQDAQKGGGSIAQELEGLMAAFGQAYFNGDIDAVEKFLIDDYEWEVEVYESPAHADEIENMQVKGLQQIDEQHPLEQYELSIEFQFPDEDSLTYLSAAWKNVEGAWKISGYGLEK